MSPVRLLLEGPDLQGLLQEIRATYGAEARIVHAEKVRRGGVAGFFAQERFTIQVEVPDALALPAAPGAGEGIRSVMDLVDQLNEEEAALHRGGGRRPPRDVVGLMPDTLAVPVVAAPGAAAVAQDGAVQPTPGGAEPAFATLASTAAQLDRVDLAAAHPTLSTESASFAEVLARLETSVNAPEPAYAMAVGGTPTLERPAALQQPPRRPAPTQPAPIDRTARTRRSAGGGPKERRVLTGAELLARARRLGVPAHALGAAGEPVDIYRRLLSWVQSRPSAPMIIPQPGQVIAVVGELEAALSVARQLTAELATHPSEIHVAVSAESRSDPARAQVLAGVRADRIVSDVADIATSRPRWGTRMTSTVVVVEARMPPADPAWLGDVVSALAPTFAWAVAQATTKVHDVVSWTRQIGRVDALALVNVASTADPVTALAGPVPIGMLDGRRASVARWMSMLTTEGEPE